MATQTQRTPQQTAEGIHAALTSAGFTVLAAPDNTPEAKHVYFANIAPVDRYAAKTMLHAAMKHSLQHDIPASYIPAEFAAYKVERVRVEVVG